MTTAHSTSSGICSSHHGGLHLVFDGNVIIFIVIIKVSSYKCVICGTSFSQGYNYKRHMLTHSGFKPYACPMCPYRSTQSNNVKRHLANVHSIS
ncbi:hypothetical protein Avbf_00232 [Armadillidium vulgare]|nr:hypothetical protein Avbf_00232 [Armadillidium vulgare]